MVVIVSQAEIEVPASLNATYPGNEDVAVIVSTDPYVGVAAFNAIEMVGVA